jgi:predicted phage terminase large subunit-like protein
LHNSRYDIAELNNIEAEIGSYTFAAQYQQNPVPLDGAIIKPSWLRTYREFIQSEAKTIIHSWDTAIKAGISNDYTVCTAWAEMEDGYYLIDIIRERLEYPELKRAIINMTEKWQPNAILIEDKGSGQSLIQDIKRENNLPVIAIKANKDKLSRLLAVSPMFEAGKVLLPANSNWRVSYEQEILSFPTAKHDDQVDSTSQFLNYIRLNNSRNKDSDVMRFV